MGANCSSQQHEDIFTSRKHSQSFSNGSNSSSVSISSIDFETTKHREDFAITSASADSQKPYEMEKMRVMKSKIILLIGENRIKVATACYIKSISATNTVQVIVGTRDPDAAKNSLLLRAGVRLIKADMTSPETLLRAIRDTKADTVFLVSPNQVDRSTQTTTGITACKRAGVGHVVVLSSTCVDREGSSIFGDQCKLLESFVKKSGMAYSLVRIPMLMDNYLSQLQSMAEYGIFYRPLPPNTKRNAVTVADIGAALGIILLNPGNYPDKTISLNGPLTDCETASEAFTLALGKTIIYEQASYESYKETLLEAEVPEWQVLGILELFRMYERQEPFCVESTKELQTILGRPPQTVFDLAKAAVARTKPRSRELSETKDGCPTGSEPYFVPLTLREETLTPYSGLNILRPVDVSPSSSLSPAGLAGLLKVTLSIGSSHIQSCQKFESKCSDSSTYTVRSLEQRYCILLDGVLTFLPPTAVAGCCNTRAIGSMENRSTPLSGYITKQVNEFTISLRGSKGENTTFLLECTSPLERFKWCTALTAHVEHVDSKVGSKWLF